MDYFYANLPNLMLLGVPRVLRDAGTPRHVTIYRSLQIILALGVSFQLIYLFHNDLWAAFVPLTGELILILYLTGLKVYYHDVKVLPESVRRPGNEGYVLDNNKKEETGQPTAAARSEGELGPENGANLGRVRRDVVSIIDIFYPLNKWI